MPLPSRVSDLTGFDLLLSVARTGSIGRAAAEHGVSQPAASARMRLLEGQLGLALIERSPRGSTLTPAGALVAGWAQAVVDAAASLDAGVVALRRERDSRLRIAASMTVAEYRPPGWPGPRWSAGRPGRAPGATWRRRCAPRPAWNACPRRPNCPPPPRSRP